VAGTELTFPVTALDRASTTLIRVADQLDRLSEKIDKVDGKVARITAELDDARADAGLDNLERKRRELDGKKTTIKVDADKSLLDRIVDIHQLNLALDAVQLPAKALKAIAIGAELANIGSATVAMSGALGVVPAIAFGAGAALATLKLGTTGFDNALKELNKGDLGKFNADVAKMAPNAQAAAFAIRDIYTTGFRNLQLDVQQRLFAGLAGEIRDLGSTYLPVLHTGLGGVADELNLAARGIADWARSSATVRDTSTLFDAVRSTMHLLAPAVVNVAQGILDVGTVGSRYLPGLAAQATNLTARFRDFMDQARQSGQLGEFIQTGIDKLEQLGRVAINAGGILLSIFRASDASGADFLSTIERITAGVNNFLRSGEGQSILTSVFREINATVDALEPGVAALAKAAAEVIAQLAQAGILHTAAEALSALAISVAPLVGDLGTLAATILPPVLSLLRDIAPVLGPVAAGFLAASLAAKGLDTVRATLTGLAGRLSEAALNAGVFTEKLTGSAAAGERLALAGSSLATGLGVLGVALPVVAVAAAGVVLAYDQMRNKSDELAQSVVSGQIAMGQAVAEQSSRIQTQNIVMQEMQGEGYATGQAIGELTGQLDANAQSADANAQAQQQVSAAVEAQLQKLPPLEQAQARVKIAQDAYNAAVAQFGATSSQAVAAAGDLAIAHDREKQASQDAANAEKTLGDQIVQTSQAASAAANADVAYQQAVLNIRSAEQAAAEAVRQHGASSLQAQQAQVQLMQAYLSTADAARRKAEADATATGASNAAEIGAQAYKNALIQLAGQASGPTRDALLAMANGTDTAKQAASTAQLQAQLYKDELGRLAGESNGPLADALHNAVNNFDNLGGAHATAQQRAQAQKDELQRLANMASGPVKQSLQAMADQIRTLPSGQFTVTGVGNVSYGSPELARAAHGGHTGGIIGMDRAGLTGVAYAAGGVMPGYTPGRDVHTFRSATGGTLHLSGGEAVMRPEWTQAVGPQTVHRMNAAARSGGVVGVRRYMTTGRYADGGILPTQRFAMGGDIRLTGTQPFQVIPHQLYSTVAGSLVHTITSTLYSAIRTLAAQAAAMAAAAARAVAGGIGVALGGGGARAWIIAHESGGNPRAQNPTSSASGLYQMIDGTWRAYGGSTAHAKDASVAEQNAVADRYVAARYGSWENAQRFWMAHHYYDQGGYLQPGATLAYNSTGQPERVLPPTQTRVLDQILAAVAGGGISSIGSAGSELLAEMRTLNGQIRALRGDVDHHNDQAALAARLDVANRFLAALTAGAGSAAMNAATARTRSELGAFY
jgi:hypothetical protein